MDVGTSGCILREVIQLKVISKRFVNCEAMQLGVRCDSKIYMTITFLAEAKYCYFLLILGLFVDILRLYSVWYFCEVSKLFGA